MAACAETREAVEDEDPVELLNLIAESYCAHLETCGVSAPEFIYSSCTETQLSEEAVERLRENIKRGVAVWSRKAFERCLRAVADDTCPIEPKLTQSGETGAVGIDLDLDDAEACRDALYYQQPGAPSLR
jgi:hypothetical protein